MSRNNNNNRTSQKPQENTQFYERLENDIIRELNKLRSNPKSYIPLVEAQMNKLKGKMILRKSQTPIMTVEGKDAYLDAIEFLSEQEPVEPLKFENKLSMAAYDLVNDIGPRGMVTHQDSFGGFCSERIEKYCEWDYCANECVEVGSTNAQDVIVSLIVDDSIFERQDRRALFQHIYNYVGVGCGPHREFECITALVFAGGIRPKGSLFYQYDNSTEYYEPEQIPRKNIANDYQINDPDAPDNTIGLRLVKTQKRFNGRTVPVTKKFYTLDDGTEHVVEIEEY